MSKALLVVDVLSGIFELPEELHAPETFLTNLERLVQQARATETPVIYVQHRGPAGHPFAQGAPGRAIHPRIAPHRSDAIVEKEHPDVFQGTAFDATLRDRAIDELVVCGFASEACVDTSVRSAYAKGFKVVLVSDAHTTTKNPVLPAAQIVAHHNFVLSRFARVQPHDEVIAAMR